MPKQNRIKRWRWRPLGRWAAGDAASESIRKSKFECKKGEYYHEKERF